MQKQKVNKALTVSADQIARIKAHEGFRAEPYQDTAGNWTIGWGYLCRVRPVGSIDRAQAEHLLRLDLLSVQQCLWNTVTVALTQGQFDALADFVFQFGCTKFRESTLLKRLNEGCYQCAAAELSSWCHVNGQVELGLVLRRRENLQTFNS
jgi:lysozyme